MKDKTYPRLRIVKRPGRQIPWFVLRCNFPQSMGRVITRCFTFKGACEYVGEYLDEMEDAIGE